MFESAKMALPFILFSVLILCKLTSGKRRLFTTYDDIIALGADCNGLDSCKNHTGLDSLDFRNCNCGKFCTDLGTCCVDSPYRSFNRHPINKLNKCSAVYGTSNIQAFMISECKPRWNGDPFVTEQCAGDGELLSDPLLTIPVTSKRTGLTYKNIFCHKCNEDNLQLPMFWHMMLEGDVELSNISFPDIHYDRSLKSWAIYDTSAKRLMNISLSIFAPDFVMEHDVKKCRVGVKSECALDWTDNAIRSKCSSYMGILTIPKSGGNVRYRNAHCALCNYESLEDMKCAVAVVRGFGTKRPFSLTLLVDVNQSDGDIVGEVNRCGSDSVYDPFFKKCRVLKCAFPGHYIVDGKCVKV